MWKLVLTVLCLAFLAKAEPLKARAVLRNPANGIDGTVTFEETMDGILIKGTITGLKTGAHGFHVHEKGDVSDPKCVSAGPHFNPFNTTHGKPGDDINSRHVGDLGNIEATDGEKTEISFIDKVISLSGNTSIIDRSLVIHELADDFGRGSTEESRTTGSAGARLVCGKIEKNAATQHQTSVFLSVVLLLFLFFSKQ